MGKNIKRHFKDEQVMINKINLQIRSISGANDNYNEVIV